MTIFILNAIIRALHTEYDDLNQAWFDLPSCLSPEARAIEKRLAEIDVELRENELNRLALSRTLAGVS